MIQFTNRDYPNFHLTIREDNVIVTVSLNISPEMKQFLPKENVVKSSKHLVCIINEIHPIVKMNEQKILSTANKLINSLMISCRQAKQKAIDLQIAAIKKQSPRILSNTLFDQFLNPNFL